MGTPHNRTNPPQPSVPIIHGCHVCGADPTHFVPDDDAVVPLCSGCDAVSPTTVASFGAAVVFVIPIDPTILALMLMLIGVSVLCWFLTRF